MACAVVEAKPLSEQNLAYWHLDPWEHISIEFDSHYIIFIEDNAIENFVCKMVAILSQSEFANLLWHLIAS